MQSNYFFTTFILIYLSSNYQQMNDFSFFLSSSTCFQYFSSISAHLKKLFPQYWILLTCDVVYMLKALSSSNVHRIFLQLISIALLEEFYAVILHFCSNPQHIDCRPPPQSFSPIYHWERPLQSFFPGFCIPSPLCISVLTVCSVPLTSFSIKALLQPSPLPCCIGSLVEWVVFEESVILGKQCPHCWASYFRLEKPVHITTSNCCTTPCIQHCKGTCWNALCLPVLRSGDHREREDRTLLPVSRR